MELEKHCQLDFISETGKEFKKEVKSYYCNIFMLFQLKITIYINDLFILFMYLFISYTLIQSRGEVSCKMYVTPL